MGESSEDIDQMFSTLLGEMDLLTQSLGVDTLPPPDPNPPRAEFNYSVGFKDLNESLNALEDQDLEALMADLVADISEAEQRTIQAQKESSQNQYHSASLQASNFSGAAPLGHGTNVAATGISQYEDDLPPPPADPVLDLPLPPPPPEPLSQEEEEAQAKADKIKLALEKLKEAKVKKLVVKVHMDDNSTKSLMVDERQLARDVLDNLFEKTHCDCNVDWCLYEIYPELQIERFFEDHENVVEVLSDWTRDTENKVLFLQKEEKYAVFKNPQNFYLDNRGKKESKETNEKMNAKNKESLLEESFCGTSIIVPELEGALYLKEDGKKSWKRRYFLLRASGIYYVPKGKTKTSRDLACFIQFENVNIYYGTQHKMKYKAPTDYCFVLKHPQIQKESQYIKYLCCDDARTLNQWVMGIRIAKYGKTLYDNYQRAVAKAGLASRWTNLGTVNAAAPAQPSTGPINGTAQPNGQMPQAAHSVSAVLQEAQRHAETSKNSYVSHLISSQPETQVIIETTGLIFYLVNQSTFMQLRKGKLSRIRSQPSGTTRSREYPGPAGPKSSLPHPVRCRGPGTPGAAPPCPPEPRVQAAGASSPCPTTSCSRSHRHRAWTTQSSRRRPRTLCPLPPQSSRGLLCPTPPTGTRHQCSQAANE
uniref:amyloid beta A4 precursor protein-binding family B member 1-interacting protein isoform X2 n=2 Tax=Macaca mulatta TaxID=9544 RepID=UPI0010A27381|nr:amyloid beta A4 precursor protein-binding family B member 1-interacting protein isoform X2 [Macaca mulatta]